MEEHDLRVAIARLEGKVDAALTNHGSRITTIEGHVSDHEARLRLLEQRPVIAPRHVYSGVALACTIITALVGALGVLMNGGV